MSENQVVDQARDGEKLGIRDLLRIRDFRLLWVGQVISNFGDSLTSLAVLLLINKVTGGSATAVALGAIMQALPYITIGLLAGVYVDRFDRKRIMIISDVLRGVFVLGLALVTSSDLLWVLYLISFIQASIGAFFNPARTAFLALIVPERGLLAANSLAQTTRIIASVAGMGAAGALISAFDQYWPIFGIDSLTFFISALLIFRIAMKELPKTQGETGASAVLNQLKQGINLIFSSKVLTGTVVATGVTMLGLGAVNVLLVPFTINELQVPETWFAALEGSQTISMVLSGALVASLAARFKPTNIISVGLGFLGLGIGLISQVTGVWGLMGILFTIGWFMTPLQASLVTLIQTEVRDELRGRASAALNMMSQSANVVSMAAAGGLADTIGVRNVFVVSGLIALLASLSSAWVFRGYGEGEPKRAPAV